MAGVEISQRLQGHQLQAAVDACASCLAAHPQPEVMFGWLLPVADTWVVLSAYLLVLGVGQQGPGVTVVVLT